MTQAKSSSKNANFDLLNITSFLKVVLVKYYYGKEIIPNFSKRENQIKSTKHHNICGQIFCDNLHSLSLSWTFIRSHKVIYKSAHYIPVAVYNKTDEIAFHLHFEFLKL